nr:hypothetical protein [Tanacetum cinerariifolium]
HSQLLSINSINSQRLDKKEQEVKNVEEHPAELRNHAERECDELVCKNPSTIDVYDNHYEIFSNSNNDDDISIDDNAFKDIEYVEASLSDPEIVKPPDDNFDLEPDVISVVMEDIDEPDEHFNPGGEIFVSTNNEDVDYSPFMFVIRFFLPYFILPEISPLFLFAESEDTIFDPGISK